MNEAPPPPFDIPPIITFAIPGFVLLIVAEMIYVRVTKRGRYQAMDSAASLMMGLGNQIAGLVFGFIMIAAYYAA